jgi:hypothetical protein
VSETPHPTDVEISRALNALVTTLNDQRPVGAEPDRWQSIVTGALGGEARIRVHRESTDPPAGVLLGSDGTILARFHRAGERWISQRIGAPRSGGYVPR